MGTDVTELFVVITVIAVALIFDYTNGFHDSANAMAGPIATGALRPRTAVASPPCSISSEPASPPKSQRRSQVVFLTTR
jgi:hypothetical protein